MPFLKMQRGKLSGSGSLAYNEALHSVSSTVGMELGVQGV